MHSTIGGGYSRTALSYFAQRDDAARGGFGLTACPPAGRLAEVAGRSLRSSTTSARFRRAITATGRAISAIVPAPPYRLSIKQSRRVLPHVVEQGRSEQELRAERYGRPSRSGDRKIHQAVLDRTQRAMRLRPIVLFFFSFFLFYRRLTMCDACRDIVANTSLPSIHMRRRAARRQGKVWDWVWGPDVTSAGC